MLSSLNDYCKVVMLEIFNYESSPASLYTMLQSSSSLFTLVSLISLTKFYLVAGGASCRG